jgi:hypothetical protein
MIGASAQGTTSSAPTTLPRTSDPTGGTSTTSTTGIVETSDTSEMTDQSLDQVAEPESEPESESRPGSPETGPGRPEIMRRRRQTSAIWPALVAVVGLFGASSAALALVRHQGIRINGDEPQYLVEAESIGRFFTLNMNPGLRYAAMHNIIYPVHLHLSPNIAGETGQAVFRHGLYFPIHSIGLSVLLAIPVLAGSRVAVMAFLLLLAVLAVGVVHLVGVLGEARSPWRFALAGLFLAPTYLLASTQVYPDLLTGMILAITILVIALFEAKRQTTTANVVTAGTLLAILPWLAGKDILIAALLLAVIGMTYRRTAMTKRELAWFALPGLVSTVAVVVFNKWALGHPLGVGHSVALTGIESFTRSTTLLFDRRSGILVQLPIVLLGIAALWTWRRRVPIAVVATILGFVAVVWGNGTEVGSQSGGSFAGRYEWPLVPILLGFTALYLIDLWRVRRPLVPLIAGVGLLTAVIEAVPVLRNEHIYYSQIPWDPIIYRGWWGGLDPSPALGYFTGAQIYNVPLLTPGNGSGIPTVLGGMLPWTNARNLWGLACILLIAAACVYWLVGLTRRPSRLRPSVLGGLWAAALICLVITLASSVQLPEPVTFSARALESHLGTTQGDSRTVSGTSQDGDVGVGPFWWVLPGHYQASVHFALDDEAPRAGVAQVVSVGSPPGKVVTVLAGGNLSSSDQHATYDFDVRHATEVAIRVRFLGSGSMTLRDIGLAKLRP